MDGYRTGCPREGRGLEVSTISVENLCSLFVIDSSSPLAWVSWSTFWHMVLHGLEGSTKAHSSLSRNGAAPSSTFPFAPGNLQPPFISIVENVKYCIESFHRRQQEESRYEFHLKVRHRVPGEDELDTVGVIFDRVRQVLDGCNIRK